MGVCDRRGQRRVGGDDHRGVARRKFNRKSGQVLRATLGGSEIDHDIAAFHMTMLAQAVAQRLYRFRKAGACRHG